MSAEFSGVSAEILLAAGALFLLVLPRLRGARLLGGITLLLLAGAANLKLPGWLETAGGGSLFFSGMLAQDRLAVFLQLAILAATALVVLSAIGFSRGESASRREFYALLLLTTAGLLLLTGARHLVFLYLGLELVSILSYLLVGFQKKEALSTEGAIKYFLFGALSTGTMLYGISILYGVMGTFDLVRISDLLPHALIAAPMLMLIALFMVLAGLAFKLALVPFHMWAPDAYEGAPTPVASYISLGPKLAGFALLLRVLPVGFAAQTPVWSGLLALMALLTMTLGNVVALQQTNVKRLLAYSSIAHAGTMLIGVAVATPFGTAALLYYLVAYLLMNAGAFAGVIAVGRADIGAFSGLARRNPALAFMITVCLLSLAGIPPLAGFFGKMWIFGAALKGGMVWLAVAAAINSVIALFYYVRIVKTMYVDVPRSATPLPVSRAVSFALALCAAGLFVVGLWQGPWLTWAAHALPPPVIPADLPWQVGL